MLIILKKILLNEKLFLSNFVSSELSQYHILSLARIFKLWISKLKKLGRYSILWVGGGWGNRKGRHNRVITTTAYNLCTNPGGCNNGNWIRVFAKRLFFQKRLSNPAFWKTVFEELVSSDPHDFFSRNIRLRTLDGKKS
jgi:hypothetical protein